MKVKFVKFDKNARIPEKAHPSDFGFDVYAVSEKEIAPNVWQYGLGFGLQIDRNKDFLDILIGYTDCEGNGRTFLDNNVNLSIDFRPRSSVWKTGMALANSCGTIDENYTGEIKLVFYHLFPLSLPRYKVGDKIAQCKIGMAFPMEFLEVDSLNETDRGDGGFGSSDK